MPLQPLSTNMSRALELPNFRDSRGYGSVPSEGDAIQDRELGEPTSDDLSSQSTEPMQSAKGPSALLVQTARDQPEHMRHIKIKPEAFPGCKWLPLQFSQESHHMCSCVCESASKCSCGDLSNPQKSSGYSLIHIDQEETHQQILGFGGALTESSAYVLSRLPKSVQKKVIESYWGKQGIGYSLSRIHINSCDFSLNSWNFDDVKDDYDLDHFDTQVTHDQELLIPLMKAVTDASAGRGAHKFIASPWSPPAWMKAAVNGKQSMIGSAEPDGLRNSSEVHSAWAKYFSKWITAYGDQGVSIWAITPQNEPLFAAPWEACAYSATSEAEFIRDYLGPTLEQDHPQVKILAYDHNKDALPAWADAMFADDAVSRYVDGLAFHWYVGGSDRELDGTNGYDNLAVINEAYPEKVLLGTEACSCPGVKLDDWFRAERFGHDIISDLNANAHGWVDWNVLLDFEGGPNHLHNYCEAPIHAFEDMSDVHFQPKFYFMGHVSKYIPPESTRISSVVVGHFQYSADTGATDTGVVPGIELSLFHCEHSSRQLWELTNDHKLKLKYSDVSKKGICVSKVPDALRHVTVVTSCDGSDDVARITHQKGTQWLVEEASGKCLTARDDISWSSGSLILMSCGAAGWNKNQQWTIDTITGEITLTKSGLCLTAGWPFLQATAFVTPSGEKSVVVMNEAPLETLLVFVDKRDGYMYSSVPAKSIQTYVY